jgi:anti-sigma factor RsiW
MSLEERDLEQLDSELDGSLSPRESAELRARLAGDPLLAVAQDELRSERTARSALWASLEPGEDEATSLADRILSAASRQRDRRRAASWTGWRRFAAIAACVLLGFAAGWGARSHRPATVAHTNSAPNSNGPFEVALTDDHGHEIAVQHFDSADKAHEFARDVRQWQERAIKVRTGTPVIVADRF